MITISAFRWVPPFAQVPYLEEDGFSLFESGAILLYLGERSEVLLPRHPQEKARAVTWVLAALNSMEIWIQQLTGIDLFHADRAWAKERRPGVEKVVRERLGELSVALGDRDYLEDRFTVGDLMMTSVLRNLRHTQLVEEFANLAAYKRRCESRPAFQKALRDQLEVFEKNAPPAAT